MQKSILTVLITAIALAGFAQSKTYPVEQLNINNFHLVDFVGWNTNMEVYGTPQCSDRKVQFLR